MAFCGLEMVEGRVVVNEPRRGVAEAVIFTWKPQLFRDSAGHEPSEPFFF